MFFLILDIFMHASSTTTTSSTSTVTPAQTSFIQAFSAASSAFSQFSFLQPHIMTASSSSPSTPSQCGSGGGGGDQRYRDKRSRNNAAVKKCREIKRKHERETIEELAKEKKKFKELTE